MDELNLKEMIKTILNEMVNEAAPVISSPTNESTVGTKKSATSNKIEEGSLPDITEVDIRKQFLVPNAADKEGYLKMKSYTPARLGLWRAGTRYMTEPSLRFRADHAAAQDAVFSYVNEDLIKELGFVEVATECKDKDEYITRPDLGRKFSNEAINTIRKAVKPNQKVQGLKMFGLDFGEVVFIKHCRVPAMDQIGEATGADVVCLLIGERPGLVTAESMSAYIAYKPTIGMPEARRTVVSNIHRQGTPAVEAGAYIAEIIKRMLDNKASGLDLKEK